MQRQQIRRPSTRERDLILAEHREQSTLILRRVVTYCLLTLFVIYGVSVMTMIFLVGFGKMNLPDRLIFTMVAQTVAQAAAFLFTVTRHLFSK